MHNCPLNYNSSHCYGTSTLYSVTVNTPVNTTVNTVNNPIDHLSLNFTRNCQNTFEAALTVTFIIIVTSVAVTFTSDPSDAATIKSCVL